MKGFYDLILPAYEQVREEMGARVGETTIETPIQSGDAEADLPSSDDGLVSRTVHSLPITDAMRDSVVQQGQPLFSRKVEGQGPGDAPSDSRDLPSDAHAEAIDDLNAAMAQQEGIPNAFQYSPSGDQGVIDAYQAVFGVDLVPIAPTSDLSAGFNGVQFHGTMFVDTTADRGFVQIAGFADHARDCLRDGAVEHYGRRLLAAGDDLASTDVTEEILADFAGDALADPTFLARLAANNKTKFHLFVQRVMRWLHDVGSKLAKAGFGSSQYFTDVEALRGHLATVLHAYKSGGAEAIGEVKFARSGHRTKTEAFQKWFGDSNAAYTHLCETMQSKETDKGVALFDEREKSAGVGRDRDHGRVQCERSQTVMASYRGPAMNSSTRSIEVSRTL